MFLPTISDGDDVNGVTAQIVSHPNKMFFVNWYRSHGRKFPWRRRSISAYRILVTEMLLRQTRATNVSSIWTSFLNRYPNPKALCSERRTNLVKRLRVLGFGNQRADALILASSWLIQQHDGKVPSSLDELLKVPHIGEYSSRAVLCFAFGHKVAIVDSNVLRFLSRYYGLSLKPDNRRNPIAWHLARKVLPRSIPLAKEHNYGLLDFTADVCKSGRPRCESCPLAKTCSWTRIDRAKAGTKSHQALGP